MVESEDKKELIKLSEHFLNDAGNFIYLLYSMLSISSEDIKNFEQENKAIDEEINNIPKNAEGRQTAQKDVSHVE